MNILTKFGGLVAVAALLMAAGSLLVSPAPVHAAADGFCSNAAETSFLAKDADAGTALVTVASGSTTKARVYIDAATADQLVTLTASAGTLTSAVLASTVGADDDACSGVGLDNVLMGAGADSTGGAADRYGTVTFVAPTVATNTLVTVTIDYDQDAVVDAIMAITVTATVTPDSLTVATPAIVAIPATSVGADPGDVSDIIMTLKEGSTALVGQTVTVITTSGLLESDNNGLCVSDLNDTIAFGVQACTAETIAGGKFTASLFGAGATGTATVTFVKGALSASQDITLFGPASSASAAGTAATMQAVTGGTNVLQITVLDANGNPVPNVEITDAMISQSGLTTPIGFDGDTDIGANTNDCGVAGEGTNGSGLCDVALTSASTTSLGVQTFTIDVPGITTDITATVTVVGVAATITNDAPASVAAGTQTEITANGLDANGDSVGAGVTTTALVIEGNGGVFAVDLTTSSAGAQVFTFVAPATAGTTSVLIQIGGVAQTVTISVGAAVPTPGEGFGGTLSSGVNLTTYGGGTVAQLGTDSADSGATSVAVTIDGAFVVYVVGAPAFVNQAFSDQYPDGVPAGTVVLVLVS